MKFFGSPRPERVLLRRYTLYNWVVCLKILSREHLFKGRGKIGIETHRQILQEHARGTPSIKSVNLTCPSVRSQI